MSPDAKWRSNRLSGRAAVALTISAMVFLLQPYLSGTPDVHPAAPLVRRCWSRAAMVAFLSAPAVDDQWTALCVQEASQRLAGITFGLLGDVGIRGLIEAVIRTCVQVKLDRHPGTAQAICVGHVLFQEEIKAAD
jgi:hypothetical protein